MQKKGVHCVNSQKTSSFSHAVIRLPTHGWHIHLVSMSKESVLDTLFTVSVERPAGLIVAEMLLSIPKHPWLLVHRAASREPTYQVNVVPLEHPAVLTLQLKVVDWPSLTGPHAGSTGERKIRTFLFYKCIILMFILTCDKSKFMPGTTKPVLR